MKIAFGRFFPHSLDKMLQRNCAGEIFFSHLLLCRSTNAEVKKFVSSCFKPPENSPYQKKCKHTYRGYYVQADVHRI